MPCFPGSGSRIICQHRPLSTMNPGASSTRLTLLRGSDSNHPTRRCAPTLKALPRPPSPPLAPRAPPPRFRWGPRRRRGGRASLRSGFVAPGLAPFRAWAAPVRGGLGPLCVSRLAFSPTAVVVPTAVPRMEVGALPIHTTWAGRSAQGIQGPCNGGRTIAYSIAGHGVRLNGSSP
jgi:hypothetical protein